MLLKRLNIPEYKITGILSETDKEIHIKIEPYKRKKFTCSGYGQLHKIGYHGKEESTTEDLSIFEKRTYLHISNVVNADERVVIWNDKGRKTEVLDRYYVAIGEDNCPRIESVALDGARTFIGSTVKYAINATKQYTINSILRRSLIGR